MAVNENNIELLERHLRVLEDLNLQILTEVDLFRLDDNNTESSTLAYTNTDYNEIIQLTNSSYSLIKKNIDQLKYMNEMESEDRVNHSYDQVEEDKTVKKEDV